MSSVAEVATYSEQAPGTIVSTSFSIQYEPAAPTGFVGCISGGFIGMFSGMLETAFTLQGFEYPQGRIAVIGPLTGQSFAWHSLAIAAAILVTTDQLPESTIGYPIIGGFGPSGALVMTDPEAGGRALAQARADHAAAVVIPKGIETEVDRFGDLRVVSLGELKELTEIPEPAQLYGWVPPIIA